MATLVRNIRERSDVLRSIELLNVDASKLRVPGLEAPTLTALSAEGDHPSLLRFHERYFRLKCMLAGAERRLPIFLGMPGNYMAGMVAMPLDKDQPLAVVTVPINHRESIATEVSTGSPAFEDMSEENLLRTVVAEGVFAVLEGRESLTVYGQASDALEGSRRETLRAIRALRSEQ